VLIHYKLRANTDEFVIKIMRRMLRKDKGARRRQESDSNKLLIDNVSGGGD
jgi:hypothetical protein